MVTVREMILEYLKWLPENAPDKPLPQTYMGLPVNLSNLDAPINGYVMEDR